MQPQPIPPNTPITVTLEAQEWNVVFGALNEIAMRIARPVFDKIINQIQQNQPPLLPEALAALPSKPNGEAPYRSNA